MPDYVYELWAERDQLRTSISMETGAANALIHFKGTGSAGSPTPPTLTDLADFTSYLTGSVGNTAPDVNAAGSSYNGGRVNRNLPLVHPFLPQMSVAGVTSITGASEGGKTDTAAVEVTGLTPLDSTVDLYPSYLYSVELVKRPYFLLPDDSINTSSGSYYPPDGSSGILYDYAEEWRRFTTQQLVPQPDTATATAGTLAFTTGSGASPNGATFANSAFMYLQNQRLVITWYMVPYRYFFPFTIAGTTYKPYLTRFVNTVNQNDWNGYPAGSLLYLGATPQPYIPQIPAIAGFDGSTTAGLAQDLLCNVTLTFLYTARETTDPPSAPTNHNYIFAGHNLLPNFADRQFYAAKSAVGGAPPFASFPTELLFTDPLTNGGTI